MKTTTQVSRKILTDCTCPSKCSCSTLGKISKKEKPWLLLFILIGLGCVYILAWEISSLATSSRKRISFGSPNVGSHVAFIRGSGIDVPINIEGSPPMKISSRSYESLVSECLSQEIADIQSPLAMKSVSTLDECKKLCDAFGSECAGFTLMLGPTFKLCDLKRSCDGIVDQNIDCVASMNLARQNRQFKKIQGCGYRAMKSS